MGQNQPRCGLLKNRDPAGLLCQKHWLHFCSRELDGWVGREAQGCRTGFQGFPAMSLLQMTAGRPTDRRQTSPLRTGGFGDQKDLHLRKTTSKGVAGDVAMEEGGKVTSGSAKSRTEGKMAKMVFFFQLWQPLGCPEGHHNWWVQSSELVVALDQTQLRSEIVLTVQL